MPPDRVILFIIGTVVILFGAYYVTYFIGMKASGQTRAGLRNRSINVLDRYGITRDKSFYIIEVAGKVYIIGAANNAMTVIDSYSKEEYDERTAKDDTDIYTQWESTPVGRYGNKLTRKVVAFVASKTGKKASFADSMKKAQSDASSGPEKTDTAEDED